MTERRGRSLRERLWRRLLRPRDLAALVAFRVAFGAMVSVSAARFLAYGWVDELFVRPRFQFKYWGFEWVPALPAPWIHAAFVALGLLGVLVAVGLFYRLSAALLCGVFTYLQLIDVSTYLNHYYLVSLLSALLVVLPAHRAFSVDAWRRPRLRSDTAPAWCTDLLRFQVATVYLFAGLAKLNADWLLHAQPLNIWLSARTSLPGVGAWLDTRLAAYAAAWGGFLFDSTVPFFLLARRTRPFAYAAVLVFHGATAALFPIGMFPVIMTVSALVFFDPSWPRRVWRGVSRWWSRSPLPLPLPLPLPVDTVSAAPTPGRWAWAGLLVAMLYGLTQLAVPLRAHLYGGNVSWHEQGMRFSWRVMSREKNGSVTFLVREPRSGREWHVPPSRYLTRLQEREMSVQPDLILQLSHRIRRDFERAHGAPVEVRADAWASLNGRPATRLIDPEVDLAQLTDGLTQKGWILAEPQGPPLRLRPLALRPQAR